MTWAFSPNGRHFGGCHFQRESSQYGNDVIAQEVGLGQATYVEKHEE